MNLNDKLDAIFREVCELPAGSAVEDDWEPGKKAGWDSLANMQLIGQVELACNITFDFADLMEISTWGAFKRLIAEKTGEP